MRALLERSGGFAGVRRTWVADEAALGPDDAARLRRGLSEAGFFSLRPKASGDARGADRFSWRLRVDDGPRSHEVRFDDGADDRLGALAELVQELAERGGAPPGG